MSIPSGPWTIKSDGCELTAGQVMTISGSDLLITGETEPWGTITGWDGPHVALVDSDGEPHRVVFTAGSPKSKLHCIYPAGTSPVFSGEKLHRHPRLDPHTGGTAISWTAEDGG